MAQYVYVYEVRSRTGEVLATGTTVEEEPLEEGQWLALGRVEGKVKEITASRGEKRVVIESFTIVPPAS